MTDTEKPDAQGLSEVERAAVKERAAELRAAARGAKGRAAGERDLLAKVAAMSDGDRAVAERLHAAVTAAAPELAPKTWYGIPAYALDASVVCLLHPAEKFGTRYATLGFNDRANLDDGTMWPTAYALAEWDADVESAIATLVRRAVS